MGESRDANDPRDQLRAMNKQSRAEFEEAERADTGGQEHESQADRESEEETHREAARAAGAARAIEQGKAVTRAPGGGDAASGASGPGDRG
jgi:hypothetical protein